MSDKNIEKNGVSLERLRKLIDTKTREEIAKRLECDASLVTKHYNGKREVTAEYVVKYAKYFGVSADYLLGIAEHKTPIDTIEGEIIRSVCDYTGLNEQAVEKLHSISEPLRKKVEDYEFDNSFLTEDIFYSAKEAASERLSIINVFLTAENFMIDIVENIRNYISAMQERISKVNNILESDNIYFSNLEFKPALRLYYFEIVESLKDIVDLYCKDIFTEYEKTENKQQYVRYMLINKLVRNTISELTGVFDGRYLPKELGFDVNISKFTEEEIIEMDEIVNRCFKEVLNNANDNKAE